MRYSRIVQISQRGGVWGGYVGRQKVRDFETHEQAAEWFRQMKGVRAVNMARVQNDISVKYSCK